MVGGWKNRSFMILWCPDRKKITQDGGVSMGFGLIMFLQRWKHRIEKQSETWMLRRVGLQGWQRCRSQCWVGYMYTKSLFFDFFFPLLVNLSKIGRFSAIGMFQGLKIMKGNNHPELQMIFFYRIQSNLNSLVIITRNPAKRYIWWHIIYKQKCIVQLLRWNA